LALSSAINTDAFSLCEVEKEDALRFLKTEEIKVSGQIGWNLICFQNLPLGWIKQLPNRSNNYFPKEWKIRMEIR
jgi:NOL1/NOP2/fmu family ribosome biogenesis protein